MKPPYVLKQTLLHGVYLDIFGLGVLLRGDSGIGKSELALSLIDHGHRLVADDAPKFFLKEQQVWGSCPKNLQNFLAVRGLGFLDIKTLYGVNSITTAIPLQLIIEMVEFTPKQLHNADLDGTQRNCQVLNTPIPGATLPLKPGRNLVLWVETLVRQQQLRQQNYDSHQAFITQQQDTILVNSV